MGLCSGAYHALKGAVSGLPVDGAIIINPLVYFWKPGMSLAYPAFQMVRSASQYRRSVLQADKWLKLIRGDVDLREVSLVVFDRVRNLGRNVAREVGRLMRAKLVDDLAAELSDTASRGVALRFIFSVGDPGEALLRAAAGRTLGKLEARGAISITHLEGCDHSLSSAWMHEALWARIQRILGP
jgi:hypothetical protein